MEHPRGGGTTKDTTGPQRKGLGRKRTKRNLGTRKGGGYSNIRKKDIQDIISRNITTN